MPLAALAYAQSRPAYRAMLLSSATASENMERRIIRPNRQDLDVAFVDAELSARAGARSCCQPAAAAAFAARQTG